MRESSNTMNLPPIKKEWNVNTFIIVAGFVLTLVMTGGGMLWTSAQLAGQINQNTRAIQDYRSATDTRISKLEADTRQIDNLAYRIQAAETASASVSRVLDDLKSAVAEQSGDIKLVKEILTRIEASQRQSSPASFRPLSAAQ